MPRRRLAGLTLTEVCAIIAVIGVLLAVFVPSFLRAVRTSKIAEAGETLATLHAGVAAYYGTSQPTASGMRSRCLPDAAGPTPAVPTVDAADVDFQAATTPGAATWRAIGFSPGRPVRYAFTLTPRPGGCGVTPAEPHETIVVLTAEGDLDGDGVRSHFERHATTDRSGELVPADVLTVRDRIE